MIDSLLRATGALVLFSATVLAQAAPIIHINGSVWDGNGGPFIAGTVYHIISNGSGSGLSVPTGRTLTIQSGAMVKIDNGISVFGHMSAKGVTFTSWHDDSIGGDSNNNGANTVPARGDWSVIEFGGTALIEDCVFRYGGANGGNLGKSIHQRGGTLTMRRCTVEHSAGHALLADYQDCTVTDSKFRLAGGRAIEGMALKYVPQLVNNTASQCDGGDYVRIVSGRLDSTTGTTILERKNSLNQSGVFVLYATNIAIDVRTGSKLIVSKGLTLKFERGRFNVMQDLIAVGTAAEPVVFTSLEDDSYGGDTNKDGNASQPSPGDWGGIICTNGAGATRFTNAIVRFGGGPGGEDAGLALHGSAVEVRDCLIDNNQGAGIYFRGAYVGLPRVIGCKITNNGTIAGKNIAWQSLPLCSGNTASGNAGGDYFSVVPMGHNTPIEVGPENYPGDALVASGKLVMSRGAELDLLAGTKIKFDATHDNGISASLGGALRVHGTAANPVIMTSIDDDSVAGDTNKNGNATSPTPGQWGQVGVGDDRVTSPSLLENLVVRYAGMISRPAINAKNGKLTIRSVRVEHVLSAGIELQKIKGNLENAVVRDAGLSGIRVHAGAYDVLHATVVDCGGIGINEVHPSFSGAVRNSISWNNTGGNYGGTLTQFEVHNSNGGFAGSNGNINQAPLFVNASSGDLHLSATSPCLGSADLVTALAVKKDHEEHSRVLDPSFSGPALPDMGAYERWSYRLKTTGQAVIGGSLNFTVVGPAGLSTTFLGFLNGGFFLPPYGLELAGASIFFLSVSAVPVGQAVTLSIPNQQSLVGLNFGVQGLGFSQAHGLLGGFTNLYRAQLN